MTTSLDITKLKQEIEVNTNTLVNMQNIAYNKNLTKEDSEIVYDLIYNQAILEIKYFSKTNDADSVLKRNKRYKPIVIQFENQHPRLFKKLMYSVKFQGREAQN